MIEQSEQRSSRFWTSGAEFIVYCMHLIKELIEFANFAVKKRLILGDAGLSKAIYKLLSCHGSEGSLLHRSNTLNFLSASRPTFRF